MTTTTRLMTAEELLHLPDDGMRHELIDGELQTMSPDNDGHMWIGDNLHVPLSVFVRKHKLGRVGQNGGFVLRRDPDTVLGPDIVFVPTDRVRPASKRRGFIEGRPDLAVEILSPSNRSSEMNRKLGLYFEAGTRLVWIIDPETRTIAVHTPDRLSKTLLDGDTLDGGDVLPGFEISVADIFA